MAILSGRCRSSIWGRSLSSNVSATRSGGTSAFSWSTISKKKRSGLPEIKSDCFRPHPGKPGNIPRQGDVHPLWGHPRRLLPAGPQQEAEAPTHPARVPRPGRLSPTHPASRLRIGGKRVRFPQILSAETTTSTDQPTPRVVHFPAATAVHSSAALDKRARNVHSASEPRVPGSDPGGQAIDGREEARPLGLTTTPAPSASEHPRPAGCSSSRVL